MTILTHTTLQALTRQELQQLDMPTGVPRRRGAEKGGGMWSAIGGLEGLYELLDEGVIKPEKASEAITDATLELASSLYSAGAAHQLWRRWIALAALGAFLTGEMHRAVQYAVLGGEWGLLKALPPSPVTSQQLSERVIWILIAGQPTPSLTRNKFNAEDHAWLQLAESIPKRDHPTTEEALKTIADFWIAESEDWMDYIPGSYPDFHPAACAAAAIARHYSFIPKSLTSEQYSFLEAGLAIPEPSPLFPDYFSLPN